MNLGQALELRRGNGVVSNETSFETVCLTGGKRYSLNEDVTPLYVGRADKLFSETPLRHEDKPVSALVNITDDRGKRVSVFYDRFELTA